MDFKKHFGIVDNIEKSYNAFLNDAYKLNNNSNKNEVNSENNSSVENDFPNFIFSLVDEFYKNTILNSLKPKDGELNIFSSIILQNKNEFKLIIFTSGTKSIPNKFAKEFKEFKIRDGHAEILAFRCLKSFLIKCITFNFIAKILFPVFLNNNQNTINKEFYSGKNLHLYLSYEEFEAFNYNKAFFDVFEFFENSKIFLKQNVFFHLYISETPCGDCSIYPLGNLNNKCCESKEILQIEQKQFEKDYNQTGAKSFEEVLMALAKDNNDLNNINQKINKEESISLSKKESNKNYNNNNDYENNINKKSFFKFSIEHDNTPGKFRTKSMRSDIKKENISFSLSCSDKLLFKNLLGIQGKTLFEIMHPIYISSITISISKNKINQRNEEIVNAIKRGISLLRRNTKKDLKINFHKIGFVFNEPIVYIVDKIIFNFQNIKNPNNRNISLDNFEKENLLLNDKVIQPFSIYWFYSKSDFNKIDPNSGFKQGTVMKKEKFNVEKSKVDICDLDYFTAVLRFLNLYSNENLVIIENLDLSLVNGNINKVFSNKRIEKVIKTLNTLLLSFPQGVESSCCDVNLFNLFSIWLKENSFYKKIKESVYNLFKINKFLDYKNNC